MSLDITALKDKLAKIATDPAVSEIDQCTAMVIAGTIGRKVDSATSVIAEKHEYKPVKVSSTEKHYFNEVN